MNAWTGASPHERPIGLRLLRRLLYLLGWAHHQVCPSLENPRRDEQQAAMHIWPTTGRRVQATPRKRPAAVGAAPAAIHEKRAHGRSRV